MSINNSFQYKMLPIRMSEPQYYDPYAYPFTPKTQNTVDGRYKNLPGREHPQQLCGLSQEEENKEIQKYFWGNNAYDLPVYDPSLQAKTNPFNKNMIFGKFNAGGNRNQPFIPYRLTANNEFQKINDINQSYAPYTMSPAKIECNKEGFSNNKNNNIKVIAILTILVVLFYHYYK